MKIIHAIDSGGLYGAEKVLLSLMMAHRSLKLDVHLASIAKPGAPKKTIEKEASRLGLAWRRFNLLPGPDVVGITRIIRYAIDEKASIIHSHGYKPNMLLALIPRNCRGVPIVATLHGWTTLGRWSRIGIYEYVERSLLNRFEKIVAVSDATIAKTDLRERLGDRLSVIRNGIDTQPHQTDDNKKIVARARDKLGKFAGSSLTFAIAGRISPDKDLITAVHAFKIALDKGVNIRLVIFGDGPERNRVEQLVEYLDITDRVLLWGYCDHLQGLLGCFDGLVISSLTEGIPIIALEAMRAGVPIVATQVGGLPEVIVPEITGLLVPPANPRALAEAIQAIAQDSKIASTMAAAGVQHLRESFNIDRMADQYLKLYREMV